MPTDISFLSASRASKKPDSEGFSGPSNKGYSKIKVALDASDALLYPHTNFHGWIRPNSYTLKIPFSNAANGTIYGVQGPATDPPNEDGNSSYEFALGNGGSSDCYTNQWSNDYNYLIAKHNHDIFGSTYLSDVIWEASIQARVLDSNYTLTGNRPPRINNPGVSGGYTFDTDGSEGDVQCELFLFGVDAAHTPFFSGWSSGTITNFSGTGLSLAAPKTDGKTFYARRLTDVSGDDWYELKMYVTFTNTNIVSLTMRVDVDTPNKTVMFANPVLRPHNISLEKILGGTGINNNSNFKFSEYLG